MSSISVRFRGVYGDFLVTESYDTFEDALEIIQIGTMYHSDYPNITVQYMGIYGEWTWPLFHTDSLEMAISFLQYETLETLEILKYRLQLPDEYYPHRDYKIWCVQTHIDHILYRLN